MQISVNPYKNIFNHIKAACKLIKATNKNYNQTGDSASNTIRNGHLVFERTEDLQKAIANQHPPPPTHAVDRMHSADKAVLDSMMNTLQECTLDAEALKDLRENAMTVDDYDAWTGKLFYVMAIMKKALNDHQKRPGKVSSWIVLIPMTKSSLF